MAARNVLSGEVLIGRRARLNRGGSHPASVLANPSKWWMPWVLVYHDGTPKRPHETSIPKNQDVLWEIVQGSDADLALIRRTGYDLHDGRPS